MVVVAPPRPVADVVVLGAKGRLGALTVDAAKARGLQVRGVARGEALALQAGDVVIDVTTAGSTSAHVQACAAAGVPIVVATTGMSADDERAIDEAAHAVPVIVAANLSVSAHVAAHLVREAAKRLPYDAEVVEVHHRKKKDAPSGTALMLARAVAEGRAQSANIKRARDGHAPRADGEVGVSAVRGGDVVGEHTVLLLGDGERIEIVHRITDRAVFARGAVAAALFLAGKPAGRYTMSDVH